MARTYRRKNEKVEEWLLTDRFYTLEEAQALDGVEEIHHACNGIWYKTSYDVIYSKKSKYGKRVIARYHSDAYRKTVEPGPMWFVREFTQVPYRQKCKAEIHKFLRDEEYEVVLRSMPRLGYWT